MVVEPSAVIVDIEGTTSAISFVHDVLFPYAARAMPEFVRNQQGRPEVAAELEQVAAISGLDLADTDALIDRLLAWIEQDRKETPLKALQGMIWEQGYRRGDFKAHIYDDAASALLAWRQAGLPLYVYSSGSVKAQQLLFGHTTAGDLQDCFRGWFDTRTGPKQEAESYRQIATRIGEPAERLLFLSDVPAELDAARASGMLTCWVLRENEGRFRLAEARAQDRHPVVAALTELDLRPR